MLTLIVFKLEYQANDRYREKYVYIYIITTLLVGGRAQNVSYIFQCVFEGGHENVSLHFEV